MSEAGLTLDAGALIALERGDRRVRQLVGSAKVCVPSTVLARVWRGGARQAPLALILQALTVEHAPLDEEMAKAVGELAAMSGHRDVVDLHVALLARMRDDIVVTSDPDDLRRIDPSLVLIEV